MFKKKRLIAMVIVLCMVFAAVIAGCGNKQKDGDKQASSQETKQNENTGNATTQETQPALEEVSLKWVIPWLASTKDEALVFAEANKIISEKIKADVEFTPVPLGEYTQKLQMMMAASDKFDICFTSNWLNPYLPAVAKGAYLPLDELLSQYVPKYQASIPEKFWSAAKVNGKIYGALIQQIYARTANLELVKPIVEKYGFDYSSIKAGSFKLEDLNPMLDKISKGESAKAAMGNLNWESLYEYYGMEALGGVKIPGAVRFADSSLTVINQFESDEFKNFLQVKKDWMDKGYWKPKEFPKDREQDGIKAGKVAMWIGGTWKPGGEADASINFGQPIKDIAASPAYITTGNITATMNAISRTSENPERAMMLLGLFNEDLTLYNTILYGIENKHFTKEGNYVKPIKDSGYGGQILGWLFQNQFNAYRLEGMDEDVWEQTKQLNETANVSAALGFSLDMESIKTEVANCQTVVDKYLTVFNSPFGSIDELLPKFLDELKKAGVDTVIQETQKQVTAWKAGK